MRISAHKLSVESGRYTKTPYKDRFCTLCQSNEIGDEFHYLLLCSNQKISETRNIFLNDLYGINSSFHLFDTNDLFLYIINIHDKSIMKIVEKYFHDILLLYDNQCIIRKHAYYHS
jgi:hypothetical protein